MFEGKGDKEEDFKMSAVAQQKNDDLEKEFYLDKHGNPTYPKDIKRAKYNMNINQRLKEARNKRGLSLAKAVKMLGVRGVKTAVSTLQGYEADEDNINHRYPSLIMLLRLANLYNCSLDYLFGLTGELERPSNDLIDTLTQMESVQFRGKEMNEVQRSHAVHLLGKLMELDNIKAL